jgi:tetratricopeptide (TPR) repeat protein
LENVRAAWLWALERGDVAGIDKAFESVYLYFDLSSRFREGSRLFDRARNKLAIDKDSITWSRLLTRHAWLRSRSAIAEPEIGEDISLGLAIAKREDNLPEIAFSKLSFGSFQSQVMNDFEGALKTFQQSLEAYQALGDKFYMAKAFHRIGYCSSSVTEGYEKFIDFTRKALDLSRETGNKVDAAMALTNLGSGFLPYGDLTTVKSYLGEAIEIAEEIGDKLTIAHATILMSIHDLLSGDVERARSRARYGLSIVEGTGYHNTIAYGLAAMCLTTAISGDFQQALHFGKLSLAEHSNKFGLVNGHWAMSIAYIGTGQMALARRHLGTAFEIHEQFGWPKKSSWLLPPAAVILANDGQETRAVELLSLVFNHPLSPTGWLEQWSVIDELRQELKQQLGQDAYESAWKRGQSLDLETAFSRLQVEISS